MSKHPVKSKTTWFGIASIVLGVLAAVLAFLGQQDIISIDAGVWGTISGILVIILRFKTTVAITLKVDDPTTPEDESKGERPMKSKSKGFATVKAMVIATAIALLAVFAMGCGTTFTAAKGELVTMDIKASQPGYITAYISGIETCKINVPDGMVTIKNVCANGRVPTLSPFGEVICIVNPCSTGTLIFQNNGMTTCK